MFYINVLLFHIFYGQSYKVQGQYVHLKEKISSDVFVFYLCNNGQTGGKSGIDINVVPAWDLVEGNSAITVAVIDQGVDKNHEDLSYCVLDGYTIGNPAGFGEPQNANQYNSKAHGMACAGRLAAEKFVLKSIILCQLSCIITKKVHLFAMHLFCLLPLLSKNSYKFLRNSISMIFKP